MNVWGNNDEVLEFLAEGGYPHQFNDGLLAWLRDIYGLPNSVTAGGSTLPDLLKRYIRTYGEEIMAHTPLEKSGVAVKLIEPAATFTSATPSSAAAGADTLLTSAGVHGLTSAVSVGSSIYISAGTGWTVGFHTITAIAVDTTGTTIQIDTPFYAGFGTPTIALANTEVTIKTIDVPPLLANSSLEVDSSYSYPSSGNNKTVRIKLNTTSFYGGVFTTTQSARQTTIIQNRGSTSSQVGGVGTGLVAGYGVQNQAIATGTVDTSVATTLNITVQPAVANEPITLERYIVYLSL